MKQPLEAFGEVFIQQVRDNALFVFEHIVSGEMKAPGDLRMHERLQQLSPEQLLVVKDVAYQMVDLCLHHTLFLFEEHPEWILSNPSAGLNNLKDISDGLAGELYSSDGWIQQFSQYAPSEK